MRSVTLVMMLSTAHLRATDAAAPGLQFGAPGLSPTQLRGCSHVAVVCVRSKNMKILPPGGQVFFQSHSYLAGGAGARKKGGGWTEKTRLEL